MLESVFGFDSDGFRELFHSMWPAVVQRAAEEDLPGLITNAFVFTRTMRLGMVLSAADAVRLGGGRCAVRRTEMRPARVGETHAQSGQEGFREDHVRGSAQRADRRRRARGPSTTGGAFGFRHDRANRCRDRPFHSGIPSRCEASLSLRVAPGLKPRVCGRQRCLRRPTPFPARAPGARLWLGPAARHRTGRCGWHGRWASRRRARPPS